MLSTRVSFMTYVGSAGTAAAAKSASRQTGSRHANQRDKRIDRSSHSSGPRPGLFVSKSRVATHAQQSSSPVNSPPSYLSNRQPRAQDYETDQRKGYHTDQEDFLCNFFYILVSFRQTAAAIVTQDLRHFLTSYIPSPAAMVGAVELATRLTNATRPIGAECARSADRGNQVRDFRYSNLERVGLRFKRR